MAQPNQQQQPTTTAPKKNAAPVSAEQQADQDFVKTEQEIIQNNAQDQALQQATEDVAQQQAYEDELLAEAEQVRKDAIAAKALEQQKYEEAVKNLQYFSQTNQPDQAELMANIAKEKQQDLQQFADWAASEQEKAAAEQEARQISEYDRITNARKKEALDEMSKTQAQLDATNIKRQELLEDAEAAYADMQRLYEEAEVQTVQDVWNKKSFGNKILAALAVAAGSISEQYGGSNNAINLIMNTINQEIDAGRQTFKNKIAAKGAMLDKVQAQLQVLNSKTQSDVQKLQFQQMQQELAMQKQQLNAQLMKQVQAARLKEAIKQGQVGPENDQEVLSRLSKEDRRRVVRLRDGTMQLADNEKQAQAVSKFQGEVMPAIAGAERILEISESGSKLNPYQRAKVATEVKALVGQLRIPFTGPGVLTEKEYDRLLDTLGNPNKLFALPNLEKQKVQTVINKLNSDLNARYKLAGVNVPATTQGKKFFGVTADNINEANIKRFLSQNKGKNLSRKDAEEVLKRKGFWAK